MDSSQLVLSAHGLVALLWFAFGTLGLQEENIMQAGIGFGFGLALVLVGFVVAKRYVSDD